MLKSAHWAGWLLYAFALVAHAESVTFSFTAPTEREDNSPLPPEEVVGYEFRCSKFTQPNSPAGPCVSTPVQVGAAERKATVSFTVPDAGGVACFQGRTFTVGFTGATWGEEKCSPPYPAKAPPKPPTITTFETVAYELRKSAAKYAFVAVGKVPLNAGCGIKLANQFYEFPKEQATITKPLTGGVIAARCQS
jgi:hypothetical protein